MRTLVTLLALAGLAVGPSWAASVGTDDARSGVPLSIAKRLAGAPQSTSPGEVRLSGVPMRQATTGLGVQRLGPGDPAAPVVNGSGVPLVRAKRT
jgi:hypothetical protein